MTKKKRVEKLEQAIKLEGSQTRRDLHWWNYQNLAEFEKAINRHIEKNLHASMVIVYGESMPEISKTGGAVLFLPDNGRER